MSKARASALLALKLDETLGEAHASLAQVQLFNDWNLAEAEASFKRAIDLKPDYETAHHWYALMLAVAGRFPEAIDRIKRAQAIAPVSHIITKDAGLIHYYAGQYDLALAECQKALDLSPDFYPAHAALGDIYLQLGRREDALAELLKANQLDGRLLTKAALGYGYAVSGQKEKALAVLNELRKESGDRPVPALYLALLYAGLGQKDAAFKWLKQASQERAYRMVYLKVDPAFASLRSDPRFTELLQDIGLAP
jgi:tetratricopeptide (TPR) repeat protein